MVKVLYSKGKPKNPLVKPTSFILLPVTTGNKIKEVGFTRGFFGFPFEYKTFTISSKLEFCLKLSISDKNLTNMTQINLEFPSFLLYIRLFVAHSMHSVETNIYTPFCFEVWLQSVNNVYDRSLCISHSMQKIWLVTSSVDTFWRSAVFTNKDKDKDVFIGPKEFVSHIMMTQTEDKLFHQLK